MELRDRVVLVTGGAQRVGRAISLRLAAAGCQVAVHYRSSREAAEETAGICRAAGVRAGVFQADLADAAQAAALVPRVYAEFGRLDVLINNASVFEPMTIDQFTLDDWERCLRVNLTAPMILVHAAHDLLRQAHGRVINLCDAATVHPWPSHLAYMASKGALDTLTKALARALAPHVNVAGIAPGIAAWPEHYDPQLRERLVAKVPLARAGSPDDIAAAVHFVLAEGDYITGTILPIDGGRHIA